MLNDELRNAWQAHECAVPVSTAPNFAPEGLVLGAGTVLVAADRPRRLASLQGQQARLLALLSVAYGKAVPLSVLGNIARAAKAWSEGDDCLAYIHLAHARLSELKDPCVAARRLFFADALIKAGLHPHRVFEALGAGAEYIDAVEKLYNPLQPRVPAGSGRISGQWTRLLSWLGGLDAAQASELGAYASRILGSGGAAAAAFGLLFIPSPNNVRVEGEVPDIPGLRYSWNRDETLLHLTYDDADGPRTFAAFLDGDVFRDEHGRVIDRVLPGSKVAIDAAAIAPGLIPDDEPRLCPAPVKNRRSNDKGLAYEIYIKGVVNPGNPTPPGLGYELPSSKKGDKMVSYDDCQHTTNTMVEIKDRYAGVLRFDQGRKSVIDEFLDQSKRQIEASGGRPVRWYFSEADTAEFARELFKTKKPGPRENPNRSVTLAGEIEMNGPAFDYFIRSDLPANPETSSVLGEKFVATLDALTKIDPMIFANWEVMDFPAISSIPLDAARPRIASITENNVCRDDYKEPDLYRGYRSVAFTTNVVARRKMHVWIIAGGKLEGDTWLQAGDYKAPPDPEIVAFPLFKAALLAINAIWPASWACAQAFRMGVLGGAAVFRRAIVSLFALPYPMAGLSVGLAHGRFQRAARCLDRAHARRRIIDDGD